MKRPGKPGAGDPHAGFDEAGAGDVARGAGLRPEAKAEDEPPDPTVRAPVLDPTVWANVGSFHLRLWAFTMTEAWAWGRKAEDLVDRSASPWDSATRRPSRADQR